MGRPRLRFKDVCKLYIHLTGIGLKEWESLVKDHVEWHHIVSGGVKEAKGKQVSLAKERRQRRRKGLQLNCI